MSSSQDLAQQKESPVRAALSAPSPPAQPAVQTAALPALPSEATFFTVQVGSFRSAADAQRLQQMLTEKGYDARMLNVSLPGKGIWHRVRVGTFPVRADADRLAQRLRSQESMSVFVTRQSK